MGASNVWVGETASAQAQALAQAQCVGMYSARLSTQGAGPQAACVGYGYGGDVKKPLQRGNTGRAKKRRERQPLTALTPHL